MCARILPAPAGARCGKLPRSCMLGGTSSGSTEGCGCAYMHADGRLPFFIRMPCERPRRELGGPRSPRSFRVHRCERPNSRVRNRSFARHLCAKIVRTARYDLCGMWRVIAPTRPRPQRHISSNVSFLKMISRHTDSKGYMLSTIRNLGGPRPRPCLNSPRPACPTINSECIVGGRVFTLFHVP